MSRILKPADDGTRVSSAQMFDLRPVEERARAIIEAAQAQIGRARHEADRLKQAARTEGFEMGRREGLEAGRREGIERGLAEAGELVASLTAVARDLERRRADLVTSAERHLFQLAIAIAERIVKARIAADPEAAAGNVKAALALIAAGDQVCVAVAPEDAERIREIVSAAGPEPQAAGHSARLVILPDEAVSRGGCIVRTAGGEVDATIETQLEEIERQLIDAGAAGDGSQQVDRVPPPGSAGGADDDVPKDPAGKVPADRTAGDTPGPPASGPDAGGEA